MKIAVTGAGGFIGRELVSYLTSLGHEVLRLQRESIAGPMDRFFDVRSIHSIPDLSGVDVLIHTAYIKHNPKNNPDSTDMNIGGTLALEHACHASGVKFIFLSCMSAHAGARSPYGIQKFALEQKLDLSKDLVLRLGLVIGKGGIVEKIKSRILKSSFVRVSHEQQPVQIIDICDLRRIISRVIDTKPVGIYNVAKEEAYHLGSLYRMIAEKFGKKPIYMHFGEIADQPGIRDIKIYECQPDMDRLGISIAETGKINS